jgi:hypothetical protein
MSETAANRFTEDQPLKIVGSNKFGRFPKQSSEQTWNMIISDDWLVPFGGWEPTNVINPTGEGRGIITSTKFQKLYFVIDDNFYSRDPSGSVNILGQLHTYSNDVFFTENNVGEVIFTDEQNLYVYNVNTNNFTVLTAAQLGFTPGYLTFQNGRVVSPDLATNKFRLSSDTTATIWLPDAQHVGAIETKPTLARACLRMPGRGNMLLVMGITVTELYQDVGSPLFPYQRNQSVNVDYGIANAATLASLENFAMWVAINEQAGPALMYFSGEGIKKISTDGIDYVLAQLKDPTASYAFMVRLSGHICYIVTFVTDNITYLYDFNTSSFFSLCDENMNAFIVKRVAFFQGDYYFVSLNDGNLYRLASDLFSYNYGNGKEFEIPMIRITNNFSMPDQSRFIVDYAGFTLQQGSFPFDYPKDDFIPRIDMSVSIDGGVNFSNYVPLTLRPQGIRKNRVMAYNVGSSNDFTFQYRFYSMRAPFVAYDGVMGVRL